MVYPAVVNDRNFGKAAHLHHVLPQNLHSLTSLRIVLDRQSRQRPSMAGKPTSFLTNQVFLPKKPFAPRSSCDFLTLLRYPLKNVILKPLRSPRQKSCFYF
jgi:hypothetical protein